MKKLSLVATLPRLDSISLEDGRRLRWRLYKTNGFKRTMAITCKVSPGEVHGGICFWFMWSQSIIDVFQIIHVRQLRYPTGQHLHTNTQLDQKNTKHSNNRQLCEWIQLKQNVGNSWNTGMWSYLGTHQAKQVKKQMCVFPNEIVGLTAQVHKIMEAAWWLVTSIDDICHVRRKHERSPVAVRKKCERGCCRSVAVIKMWGRGTLFFHVLFVFLPFDVAKHLCMPQELAEVNMEHVSTGLQHDVVVVPVAYA